MFENALLRFKKWYTNPWGNIFPNPKEKIYFFISTWSLGLIYLNSVLRLILLKTLFTQLLSSKFLHFPAFSRHKNFFAINPKISWFTQQWRVGEIVSLTREEKVGIFWRFRNCPVDRSKLYKISKKIWKDWQIEFYIRLVWNKSCFV